MGEGQMVFLFCVIYSGVLSVVVWINLILGQRVRAHLKESDFNDEESKQFKQSA